MTSDCSSKALRVNLRQYKQQGKSVEEGTSAPVHIIPQEQLMVDGYPNTLEFRYDVHMCYMVGV